MIKKHIIWSDMNLNLDDWKDTLLEENPAYTEEEMYQRMFALNSLYLCDERLNLSSIILERPILVIGDLGLWNGRRSGYKLINSGKVSDCLFSKEIGDTCWYVDERGNFRGELHHHDGTNYMLYRGIRPWVSEENLNALTSRIYEGKDFSQQLARLTFRLGDLIGDVYGWTFAKRPKFLTQLPTAC